MSGRQYDCGLPMPNYESESVVAFYLTQETDLPAIFQGGHQVVTIKIPGSLGNPVEKPALRVTFSHNQSIEEPVGLVAFGYDPRCHVRLPADSVSSVHCRIYAQLNSGPRAWLVDDSSTQGTKFKDDETLSKNLPKIVHGRCQAALGLYAIIIGPYTFKIGAPVSSAEVRRCEDWFRLNRPIPVTNSLLNRQLGEIKHDWLRMECVGEGGNGKVYKYMEKNTALFVAIREEMTKTREQKAMVMKEISFMKNLRHPFLVDFLFDKSDNQPLPTIFTAMPLPWPLEILTTTAEYAHDGANLKPDNVLVVSPGNIKIADYGWAISLKDTDSLYGACGTIAYCAPEALFKPNEIHTPAIDLYSLGCIFYSMINLNKVDSGWVRRDFNGNNEWFNTTFENASDNPPCLFAGLIKKIVKAQKYDWQMRTALMPVAAPTACIAGQIGTPQITNPTRLQQTPFGKVRATAKVPKAAPVARIKQPQNRQIQLIAPVKHDFKNWQPIAAPAAPTLQAVPVQKPCHVQGVDFNAGLPSYEEATSQNPFAAKISRGWKEKKSLQTRVNPSVKVSRNLRQIVRRSRQDTMSNRRAQTAGVHKQLERRAATKKRLKDLMKGAYDVAKGSYGVAKGCYVFSGALLGLVCEGLVVGSERIYRMLNDNPAARKALENAVPSINANEQLVTSMQRHSVKAALSNRLTASARYRPVNDQEMVDLQLMLSWRRR